MTMQSRAMGVFFFVSMLFSGQAQAMSPDEIMAKYAAEVKKTNKSFKEFSAAKGKAFYSAENTNKKGETMSCATCHTPDPTKAGKTEVGKKIDPIAISANKKRFTDLKKVEKWFKRNCKDVLDRECTAQEKGDFIAYMKSAK